MKPEDLDNLNNREIKALFCDFYNDTDEMFSKARGIRNIDPTIFFALHISNCKKITKILKK